uniref:Uncharacterized protein n=1 Tax=Caenorhabditis japonica TaxID=281687 RepID=A0A8R1DWP6_CAEJA
MKSQPYPYPTNANQWMMPVTHEQINNSFQKACASTTTANSSVFKMKTTKKRSPKHTPLPPLPSISTLLESGSSSHSSSTNSSYGSYCQFSPEGSYTMYHWPMNYLPYVAEMPTTSQDELTRSSMGVGASTATSTSTSALVHAPPMSADEHTPVTQPLFIQTADYPYNYATPDPTGGYPSSATINANQLLLRPVPNGHV